LSDDKSQEYFSDGLTDDLITDLSKISGLFVIARNSTFAYKGKSVKIQQVAEELGVRYVLEGSVRREGDQVRINAQFVDALTGRHLWAERYDGNTSYIFSLQDEINQKIVAALALKLNEEEKGRLAKKWTNSVAAYDEYLRGRGQASKPAKESYDKAEAYYKRALDLDPNFTQARAALALLFKSRALHVLDKGEVALYQKNQLLATYHLREAMKEPTALAYRLSGEIELLMRQHDLAVFLQEKALSLDSNDPNILGSLSWALCMTGRPAEAIEHAERAMRLDPVNPDRFLFNIGVAHFCLGNMEEAASLNEKMLKTNPEWIGATTVLASTYAHLGRNEQARAAFETYRMGLGNLPLTLANVMFHWPFKEKRFAELFAEGLIKAGMPGRISDYIHVAKKDQLTGDELREFFYPSTIIGFGPGGSQWSSDFEKDGTVTLRAPYVPGGEDTGRSWLVDDKLWISYPKYTFGMAYARTTFKNPGGTPEQKNEYVSFTDIGIATFSRAR
jgi:TolB-like protein/Tfp pilus assembly protein PilF